MRTSYEHQDLQAMHQVSEGQKFIALAILTRMPQVSIWRNKRSYIFYHCLTYILAHYDSWGSPVVYKLKNQYFWAQWSIIHFDTPLLTSSLTVTSTISILQTNLWSFESLEDNQISMNIFDMTKFLWKNIPWPSLELRKYMTQYKLGTL
jgi:hypothetical protein